VVGVTAPRARVAFWLLAVALPGGAVEAARGPAFGPRPAWVQVVAPDLRPSPDPTQISDGIHYLLVDRQIRVGPRGEERYRHFVKRLVNEAGLETASQLSVSYDPTYESLELHSLRVRRRGAVLDRLARERIEVVQRESGLEAQMYDGTLSAVLFIEDLRVGDVVEYDYTVRGANPVLGGRFSQGVELQWSLPVRRLRFRLLWPPQRPLFVRNHGTSTAPVVDDRGGYRQYLWDLPEPAPPEDPGDVPAWYPRWAWVQLGELWRWAEVVEWALPLYSLPSSPSAAILAQVEAWRRLPTPSDRARAALRFVQDEVRYVGIEMGSGSHQPNRPELVLSRRFGDCKDKSLLLSALLGALGVRARPALVHTSRGRALDDWLPTPDAFNHVVTRVELDGRTLWLDPTRSAQGGRLEETYFPPYERALVVDQATEGLSVIPVALPEQPTEIVEEEYRVGGEETEVEYLVETHVSGPHADRTRYDLRRRSREEVAKGYLDFYARSWQGIRALGPLEVEDDRESNVIVIRERYAIPGFWSQEGSPGRRHADLWASTLSGELGQPSLAANVPLAVAHPVFLRHRTRVLLPGDFGLEPESEVLSTPAVRFAYRAEPDGDSLELQYDYQTVADTVLVDAVDDHLTRLDAMWNRLEYRLAYPASGSLSGTNWIAALTLGLGFALSAMGAGTLVRMAARSRVGPLARRRVASLSLGALVLAAASIHSLGLARCWRLCQPVSWAQRTHADGTLHHPLWAPFLLLQLVALALLMGAVLLLLALLAKRRRAAVPAFVVWAFVQTAFLFAVASVLAALPGGARSGLDAAVRDAVLSLVALVPGTAIALAGRRDRLSGAPAVSRR
jgi:transglutaminase-like putative cysteine protease